MTSHMEQVVKKAIWVTSALSLVFVIVIVAFGSSAKQKQTPSPCPHYAAGSYSTISDFKEYMLHLQEESKQELADRKSLIVMLADGFGPSATTLSRLVKAAKNGQTPGAESLYLDEHLVGAARTYSADSLVTDSAAGITAYSCASKTNNGMVSVLPNTSPIATLMEAARAAGMATGVVATSRITHATPAGFTSHSVHRDMEAFIAWQQAQAVPQVDVMLGGGRRSYMAKFGTGNDAKTVLQIAQDNGYQYVQTRDELLAADGSKPLLGLFADSHMHFEIDRPGTEQPSLQDMAKKALSILQSKNKPFLLFIEGSRVDQALHMNDPASATLDAAEYDDTFHAMQSTGVSVVSVADHNTGGSSVGAQFPDDEGCYPKYFFDPSILLRQKESFEKASSSICKRDESSNVLQMVENVLGEPNLSSEESNLVTNVTQGDCPKTWPAACCADKCTRRIQKMLSQLMTARAKVGFTSKGHTGVDINVYAAGDISGSVKGNMQNTDVGHKLFEYLGLTQTANKLSDAMQQCNLTVSSDQVSELSNAPRAEDWKVSHWSVSDEL